MADISVVDLGALASPASDDVIPIYDVSAGQLLKVTRAALNGGTLIGAGTVDTGGFTLTVPATGTAALATSGTWTPAVDGTTGSPTVTYTTRNGYYYKVGSLVYLAFRIVTSAISGGAGNLIITGLPFTSANNTGTPSFGVLSGNLDWSASKTMVLLDLEPNDNKLYITQQQDATSALIMPIAGWPASGLVQGSIVYQAA